MLLRDEDKARGDNNSTGILYVAALGSHQIKAANKPRLLLTIDNFTLEAIVYRFPNVARAKEIQ